jgi:hypothetical protein
MARITQVIEQIRFGLEQLSARNGMHEFERLCRHYARNRICSNILPSSGPVSAGGDQGQDFESFRTYLKQSPISNSSFIGLVSEGPIAFACTLTQKDNVSQKIKSDIKTIMSSGVSVFDIHYFCTCDIPVALRHKLKKWSQKNYETNLEIHDGQALSEHLSDRDIFWIAEEFLNIPADIYPPAPRESDFDWYNKHREEWKNSAHPPINFSDFFQIKNATRFATSSKQAKQDISFWIGLLKKLITSSPYELLKRKATYEITVASLRGLGSLIGYEQNLRKYFGKIPNIYEVSELEDVAVLLEYCIGAHMRNVVELKIDELSEWKSNLITKIQTELQKTDIPGRRCHLLEIWGFLRLMPGPRREEIPDPEAAIKCWLELASIVEKALSYPLERFADRLVQLIEVMEDYVSLADYPDFRNLSHQVDRLLSERVGGFVAAEKCRDRSMAFYKKGKIIQAIKELHVAKIKWLADETLKGALLATLFISKCYFDLGLIFASKYYALAASYISLNSSKDEVKYLASRALITAAECDYIIGAFHGFFDLTDIGLKVHSAFSKEDDPSDSESEINRILYHSSTIYAFSKCLAPNLLEDISIRIKKWKGFEDYFEKLIPVAEKTWCKKDFSEVWPKIKEQMLGRPFSDFGQKRSVEFLALGIVWNFKFNNNFILTSLAEEFIAYLQVLLADFADTDLCLLPTKIDGEIKLGTEDDVGIVVIPSNEKSRWRLTLAENDTKKSLEMLSFSFATWLLMQASLLPENKFKEHIETLFKKGLMDKVFFAQRYKSLYQELVNKKDFNSGKRRTIPHFINNIPFHPIFIHNQMNWHGTLGPGYSKESSKEAIKNRYERSILPIKYTIARFSKNPKFKRTVSILRQEGWLDWHILLAVALATVNYRVRNELGPNTLPEKYQNRFFELMNNPEKEDLEPIPFIEFSKKNLHFQLHNSMLSTLKSLGFEIHQPTPDFNAISVFLGKRYNYWTDDIDHLNYGF